MKIISLAYNFIIIPILFIIRAVLKLTNKKMSKRESSWRKTLETIPKPNGTKRILFHAASMGEFEQAKPVIEHIKSKYPNIFIVCSFYSPSGYETQKTYEFADAIVYMPFDTKRNASAYLDFISPDIAVFVRYEIWHNHLSELKRRNIPAILISATMPNNKFIRDFPILKDFTRANYSLFHKIYTTGYKHTQFFENIEVRSEIITHNDTRADRIIEKVESSKDYPILPLKPFNNNHLTLVAGSSWPEDETLILQAQEMLQHNINIIFVPHEPTEKHISTLISKINSQYVLLSEIEKIKDISGISKKLKDCILIVDSIGKLLNLYSLADAVYIGGAFRDGVHSVSEPAGYGLALCSGPNIDVSPDAVDLLDIEALKIVKNAVELANWLRKIIENEEYRTKICKKSKQYIYNKKGASSLIAIHLIEMLNTKYPEQ